MFHYYGTKRQLAAAYPPPDYPLIIEPFAGSAAYAIHHLRLNPNLRALLFEKNPRVHNVWTRLLALTPDQVLALPRPAAGEWTRDFLYMTTEYSNAIAHCSGVTITPRMEVSIPRMLEDIAWTLSLVQGRIDVVLGDYRDAPDTEATWYIDPPYQTSDKEARTAKGNGYGDYSADKLDFTGLGRWCQSRPGQIIVAEQLGADWLPFVPLRNMRDSQGQRKLEVWWTNRRPRTLFDE